MIKFVGVKKCATTSEQRVILLVMTKKGTWRNEKPPRFQENQKS